ncbi:hypothetical protein D3C76_1289400 [compost metagenome]
MPEAPTITNASCQPLCRIAHTTSGGASKAPSDEPILNQPIATERSLAGNHSVVALTPAGKPAASVMPSSPRMKAMLCQPVARAAPAQASDQAMANTAKPSLVPMKSMNQPATGCMRA